MALWPLLLLVAAAFAPGALGTDRVPSPAKALTIPTAPSTRHISPPRHTDVGTLASSPTAEISAPVTSLNTAKPETSLTSRPPEITESAKDASNGTTGPVTGSQESLTSQKAVSTNHSTATEAPGGEEDESRLAQKPGLVAVICIFLSILLIGAVVVVVKCCRAREPAFQKLDEVPMQGKAAEDSPFARYPPK